MRPLCIFVLPAEKPETIERAFYDTFDGLVRAAGFALLSQAGDAVRAWSLS